MQNSRFERVILRPKYYQKYCIFHTVLFFLYSLLYFSEIFPSTLSGKKCGKFFISKGLFSVWYVCTVTFCSLNEIVDKDSLSLLARGLQHRIVSSTHRILKGHKHPDRFSFNYPIASFCRGFRRKSSSLLRLLLNSRFSIYLRELYPLRVRKVMERSVIERFTLLSSPFLNRRKSNYSKFSSSLFFDNRHIKPTSVFFNRVHNLYKGRLRKLEKKVRINYRGRFKKRKNYMLYYYLLQRKFFQNNNSVDSTFLNRLQFMQSSSSSSSSSSSPSFPELKRVASSGVNFLSSILFMGGARSSIFLRIFYFFFISKGWFLLYFPIFYLNFIIGRYFVVHYPRSPKSYESVLTRLFSKLVTPFDTIYRQNLVKKGLSDWSFKYSFRPFLSNVFFFFLSPTGYVDHFILMRDFVRTRSRREFREVTVMFALTTLLPVILPFFRLVFSSRLHKVNKKVFHHKKEGLPLYFSTFFMKHLSTRSRNRKFVLYMKLIMHFYTMKLNGSLRKSKNLNTFYLLFKGHIRGERLISWERVVRGRRFGSIKRRPRKFILRRYFNIFSKFLPRYLSLPKSSPKTFSSLS